MSPSVRKYHFPLDVHVALLLHTPILPYRHSLSRNRLLLTRFDHSQRCRDLHLSSIQQLHCLNHLPAIISFRQRFDKRDSDPRSLPARTHRPTFPKPQTPGPGPLRHAAHSPHAGSESSLALPTRHLHQARGKA